MKSDKSTFKDTHRKNICEPQKLKHHFMDHFNQQRHTDDPTELIQTPDFILKLQDVKIDCIQTSAPDLNEIRSTLKKLKNGKSANDIPAEYLKYAESSDEYVNEMVKMYKMVWTTLCLPRSWAHTKLVSLWKGPEKGSSKDPETYRGLQIGSTLCKIMVIIIINRLKLWYDSQLLDQQQGFRSGRGTTDGIYIIKRVQQITDKMNKSAYILFVDLTAALYHVVRHWVFKSIY